MAQCASCLILLLLLVGPRPIGSSHVELLQHRLELTSTLGIEREALTWVHIPKCGSSFLNTLVNMPGFCPAWPAATPLTTLDNESFLDVFYGLCPSLCDERKLHCNKVDHECLGEDYYGRAGSYVAMFRQPEQRLLSLYTFFWPDASGHPEEVGWTMGRLPRPPLKDFLLHFQGLMAYQLTAEGDLAPKPQNVSASELHLPELPSRTLAMGREAAKRVRDGFAFVGLTEQWDLSICLFHAMFGGPCLALDFKNTRPTEKKSADFYDTTSLQGWKDEVDHLVYQAALEVFSQNLLRYNVTPESCRLNCFGPASA